ncbi:sensor histidine kinase [Peribacillus sp. SCS-155]|uniref:sensor histidine kinase n=1 Tax=Peribacillus sedimenti TaxID=3115297 RepID=UPI00390652D4
MIKKSIVLKLSSTIMILFLIVLLPLFFTISHLFSAFYLNQTQHQIDKLASQYAGMLAKMSEEDSLQSFRQLASLTHTEFLMVNSRGTLVFSTEQRAFPEGTRLDKILTNPVFSYNNIRTEYRNPNTSVTYLISGEPFMHKDELAGGIYAIANVGHIKNSLYNMEMLLLISVLVSLMVALVFTYFASKKLSAPLLHMERVTREIAKGKLSRRVTVSSHDELGTLGTAINDLGRELETHRNNQKEFFANISHELRTPISYIKGYAQVLNDGLYGNEEEKRLYLSILQDESQRLTTLMNDLFELSKIEEGRIELTYEWVNIGEILEDCIQKSSLKAKEKGVTIYQELEPNMPLQFTDGLRIEQIILNLVENAIMYNKMNGSITIRCWMEQQQLCMEVQDAGVGIPTEDLEYIFERFYRVDKSRSRSFGGTGLGLSIVKKLVKLLNGDIQVWSKLNKGTVFSIRFLFQTKQES